MVFEVLSFEEIDDLVRRIVDKHCLAILGLLEGMVDLKLSKSIVDTLEDLIYCSSRA
jgi:hypothetical protein